MAAAAAFAEEEWAAAAVNAASPIATGTHTPLNQARALAHRYTHMNIHALTHTHTQTHSPIHSITHEHIIASHYTVTGTLTHPQI